MTPDELVVIMLERLAKANVDFTVESYEITRAAADRLLRTVGAIPEEPKRQIEAAPIPHVAPNPALASPALDSPTQTMPIYRAPTYRQGRREVYSGS